MTVGVQWRLACLRVCVPACLRAHTPAVPRTGVRNVAIGYLQKIRRQPGILISAGKSLQFCSERQRTITTFAVCFFILFEEESVRAKKKKEFYPRKG